jgi:membrane protease YdiL (CAAX protease family)
VVVIDRRLAGWLVFVGLLIAANVSARFTDVERPAEPLYSRSFLIGGAVTWAIFAGFVVLIGYGAWSLYAVRRPARGGRTTLVAIASIVAVIASGFVLRAIGANPTEEQGLIPETWPPPSAWVLAGNVVIVAVIAPVIEELTFRGLGFGLFERFGTPIAVLVSAVAFAAAHALLEGFLPILLLGLGLGVMRALSGSVLPSIVLHASFNGLQLAAALAIARSG